MGLRKAVIFPTCASTPAMKLSAAWECSFPPLLKMLSPFLESDMLTCNPLPLAVRTGRHEGGVKPAARRHRLDHVLEGGEAVGRAQGVAVLKVDLVLTGPLLVVGTLRPDAHLLERQADFPANIFAPVVGRHVEIAGCVVRRAGGASLLVGLKKIKLAFRADPADVV